MRRQRLEPVRLNFSYRCAYERLKISIGAGTASFSSENCKCSKLVPLSRALESIAFRLYENAKKNEIKRSGDKIKNNLLTTIAIITILYIACEKQYFTLYIVYLLFPFVVSDRSRTIVRSNRKLAKKWTPSSSRLRLASSKIESRRRRFARDRNSSSGTSGNFQGGQVGVERNGENGRLKSSSSNTHVVPSYTAEENRSLIARRARSGSKADFFSAREKIFLEVRNWECTYDREYTTAIFRTCAIIDS